ncbi:MAG: DUF222 domain-containing protein [Pseudonocardiaceae bacterium]
MIKRSPRRCGRSKRCDWDALRAGIGTATMDYGQLISARDARRLACDCKLIPVVLGGDSEPLDVGRAMRTVPLGIRRVLVARDRGCSFPGCDRLPGLCAAHHARHWANGGATSVANCRLLCPMHHQQVQLQAGTSPSRADASNSDHPRSSARIAGPSPTHSAADHFRLRREAVALLRRSPRLSITKIGEAVSRRQAIPCVAAASDPMV